MRSLFLLVLFSGAVNATTINMSLEKIDLTTDDDKNNIVIKKK